MMEASQSPLSTVSKKMRAVANPTAEAEPDDAQLTAVQNPLIVQLLLQYCTSVKDLKTFRQVCRLWHSVSLGTWRKHVKLNLRDDSSLKKCRAREDQDAATFEEMVALLQPESESDLSSFHQLQEKPFRHIQISSFISNMNRLAAASLRFRRLWTQLSGPHLTSLWLGSGYIRKTTEVSLCRMIFVDCPNLQRLVLDKLTLSPGDPPANRGIEYGPPHAHLKSLKVILPEHQNCRHHPFLDWTRFLQNLPNLEEIRFSIQYCSVFTSFLTSLHQLRREDPTRLQLRRLHLFDETTPTTDAIPNELFELLEGTQDLEQLQLEELSLEFPSRSNTDLRLASLRMESLQKLHLFDISPSPDAGASFQLPNLPNLLELRLEGDFSNGLSFLRCHPLLQRLDLGCVRSCSKPVMVDRHIRLVMQSTPRCLLQEFQPFEPGLRMTALTHLRLTGHAFLLDLKEESIRDLAHIMPNLTVLEMVLDVDTFRIACESWPRLQRLRIEFEENFYLVDDEELTGYEMKYQSLWEGELEKLTKKGKIIRRPSITQFQDLRHFTLVLPKVRFDEEVPALTDFFVDNGLLKLPSLVSVNILYGEKDCQEAPTYTVFTEAARQRLRARVPIVNIEFDPAVDENPKRFLLTTADCLEKLVDDGCVWQ